MTAHICSCPPLPELALCPILNLIGCRQEDTVPLPPDPSGVSSSLLETLDFSHDSDKNLVPHPNTPLMAYSLLDNSLPNLLHAPPHYFPGSYFSLIMQVSFLQEATCLSHEGSHRSPVERGRVLG